MTDEDKIPGVVSGTIDVTDPSYSKEAAEQIKEANSNGEISGDTIQTDLVANLGYGYVGFNANRVKVGDGNGGDEASRICVRPSPRLSPFTAMSLSTPTTVSSPTSSTTPSPTPPGRSARYR